MKPIHTLAEWLAESPSRRVVIKRSETVKDGYEMVNRPGHIRFNVFTALPDGRRVVSGVEIHYDLLDTLDVDVGSYVVEQAKRAVEALLGGQ